MRKLVCFSLLCVLLFAAQTLLGQEASANGAPVKVVLTYLPDMSNWGPANASGVAEVVKKEGIVKINLVGLPSLEADVYWAWLVNTRNNESLSVGPFNTDKSGVAAQEFVLPAEIPDTGWNLFLLTVEGKGQTATGPGGRKSIGGYFPDSSEGRQLPSQLPRTGGELATSSATPAGAAGQPPLQDQSVVQTQTEFKVFNGLTFGVVGLTAISVGLLARSRMRKGSQTRNRR